MSVFSTDKMCAVSTMQWGSKPPICQEGYLCSLWQHIYYQEGYLPKASQKEGAGLVDDLVRLTLCYLLDVEHISILSDIIS